jgi:hypothetical protein
LRSAGNLKHSLPAVSIMTAWALIGALLLTFAVHVWPTGAQDSQFFLPPAVEYRTTGELVHPFWEKADEIDPTGQGRLVYHGFLFPLLVGSLAPSAGYPGVHMVVMCILVAALGLFALAAVRTTRRFPEAPLCGALLGVLAVTGLATALLGLSGRPEPLGMLIILGCFHAMMRLRPGKHWIPAGVALGLLGVTSPLPALLGLVLFALYAHYRFAQRAALIYLVAAGGMALLLVVGIASLWYPYSLPTWIAGLRAHWATTRNLLKDLIHYWFTNPRNSFYGLLYVSAAILGLFSLRHRPIKSKAGFAVSALVLLAVMARYHLYSPGINYNLIVFAPLVYLAVMFTCLEIGRTMRSGRNGAGLRPVLCLLVLGVFLLTSMGFARTLVIFPRFLDHGVTYAEAKQRLADLRAGASGPVLITPALFGLVDDYDNLGVLAMPHHPVPKTYEIVVFAQFGLARQTPPRIDGYRLVEDRFDHEPPRIFGIKVANSNHGYDYAVYRRDPAASG